MKNKIDPLTVKQVKINFTPKDNWLRIRTKVKDSKCENCNKLHTECNGEIALAIITNRANAHLCEECAKYFIKNGAEDVNQLQINHNIKKEKLIKQAKRIGIRFGGYFDYKESELDVNKLKEIIKNKISVERKIFNEFLNLPIEIKNTLNSFTENYNIVNSTYPTTAFNIYKEPNDYFSEYDEITDRSSHRWMDYLTVRTKMNNKVFSWTWATCNGDNSIFDQGFTFDFDSLKEIKPQELITDKERIDWLEKAIDYPHKDQMKTLRDFVDDSILSGKI